MLQHFKYISLSVLVVQTTALVLILRYSRTVPVLGPRYLSSTTVLLSEVIKIFPCLIIVYCSCGYSIFRVCESLYQEIWLKPRDNFKILVLAFLYTIQNNLLFLALSTLDAATYQVTYQLKILTTAMFSVMMLHKHLEPSQWFSLVLLMVGVALVQMPSSEETTASIENVDLSVSSQFLGLLVILIACFLSAFSGVYFEKIVKTSSQSLWIRNIQLALFSVFMSSFVVLLQDFNAVKEHGFFQGYSFVTWVVILLQAFGGLVVSTVIKYADNILKGFATSLSIVLSTVCSYYLLTDFSPTKYFLIGASIVIIATMLYGYPIKLNFLFRTSTSAKTEDKSTS